ncbi:Scm3p NDAI_0A02140 [Naumovozyma dairenensis CBS 421]|uniref:Uncharacterized protein n=1 Tax=Naumovozyma dairenensis (strain ATCC 10597 / BCRC 20456 / CBS 421 / NBRC 0211 / NRRL Y-12639) TaxID=1071378 RepID=G0W3I4_NAUDC|nr:hypothetical protein NDAI_0A02140 [Naumovozyma dairenensis CBS 421]CCD22372.1 hypothetical protein NDAI_0A02140 [Naumovozyma dairenensis CBS 421]
MKISKKKKSKKLALKSLHGALRGLLNESPTTLNNPKTLLKSSETNDKSTAKLKETKPKHVKSKKKSKGQYVRKIGGREGENEVSPYYNAFDEDNNENVTEKNGIIYIKSRENILIPKLTDDEVMERHKKADETMKEVWTNIINKYESVETQGDLIDLKTGEIIEDNGHIRGLQHGHADTTTRYQSTHFHEERNVNDEYSIWQDGDGAATDGSEID